MKDTKICSSCNSIKNIEEFVTRKIRIENETKIKITSICKSCNRSKSKLYYSLKKKSEEYDFGYLYRFLDKEDNVLYIGKTSNITRRIRDHIYGKSGLNLECHKRISKIQTLKFNSKTLRDICEIYFINIFKPPYNKEFNYDEPRIYIKELDYYDWTDFDFESMLNLSYEEFNNIKLHYKEKYNLDDDIKDIQNSDRLYFGKGTAFIRERSGKFNLYIEYKDIYTNKRKQILLSKFRNKNIALCELERIKGKKKDGNYTIDIKEKVVI